MTSACRCSNAASVAATTTLRVARSEYLFFERARARTFSLRVYICTLRYDAIQLLRAVAVTAVVACHTSALQALYASRGWSAPAGFDASVGAAGVDLFFVVSGFLMAGISRFFTHDPITARAFFARRIERIVPLYWLYTSALLALCLAAPQLLNSYRAELPNVLGSYFFIPVPRSDGLASPLVFVGWTLNLEMAFYLLFGLTLFFTRGSRVAALFAMVCAMALGGALLEPAAWWQKWLLDPLYLEFLYGMLLGYLCLKGCALPRWLAWTFMLGGLALIPLSAYTEATRPLSWGLCALVAVFGAVSIRDRLPRWPLLIGDASYSIYLSHFLFISLLASEVLRSGANYFPPIAFAGGLAVGLICYVALERPLLALIRRPKLGFMPSRAI